MGLWSEHGTSWYSCNRFEEKSGSSARDAQARSRKSLERYLHYYNRYSNHEQSAKLDKGLYLKTERKMMSLQSQSGLSWIEVQFLDTASRTLQQCRQTLKWTYAFAFYLARNNLTEIFEDNQRDLEMAVEALSEMFEKPVAELAKLKVDILDKTTYCNKRRVILLSDIAQNLESGMLLFFSLFLAGRLLSERANLSVLFCRRMGVQHGSQQAVGPQLHYDRYVVESWMSRGRLDRVLFPFILSLETLLLHPLPCASSFSTAACHPATLVNNT